jgi:hypothetical protein
MELFSGTDFAEARVQLHGKTMNHKLKKTLLATSCLTAISIGAAQAAIINESSMPGQDFSNNLSTATSIPLSTTRVNGSIPSADGDNADYFVINGFAPGTEVFVDLEGTGSTREFFVYTSINADSFSSATIYNGEGATVTVGALGLLAFGYNTEGDSGTYSISIDAPPAASVPVPTSAALLGIGAAAAAGLRRRKHGDKK